MERAIAEAGDSSGTARLAYVECRAALARALRDHRLTRWQEAASVARLDHRWSAFDVIDLDQSSARRAGEMVLRYALRAGDAVHLAAASRYAGAAPALRFVCWDVRLRGAARALGFVLVPDRVG